jgi:hypothetical protein
MPLLTTYLLAVLIVAVTAPAAGAELQPRTIAAFDRYVSLTESRMASRPTFLWVDSRPEKERAGVRDMLFRGDLLIRALETQAAGRAIDVPDGLIHHWVGAAFLRNTTVAETVALLQNYDGHADIYKPAVARSRLLARNGERFRVYLRFVMKKVITVVVNSEHDAQFTHPAPDRVEGHIRSTRIAEVEHPDTPQEAEKPVGMDGGYLWRLNTYWRLMARDDGTYIECESISLSRNIPTGLGWLIRPFVTSIPRESLVFTLQTTRNRLARDARNGSMR